MFAMFDFASMKNYYSQPQTNIDRWMKDENVAFCEDSNAFHNEKKESGVRRILSIVLSGLVK